MEKFELVLESVKKLLPESCEIAIAGGAVRDYLLGVPCKDIDVVIISNGEDGEIASDLISLCYGGEVEVKGFFETYGGLGDIEEEVSDFQKRLVGVVKIELHGMQVDLLFQREGANIFEVVQGYDHVANMVYWKDGEYHVGEHSHTIERYINRNGGFNTDREIRTSRIAKMSAIFDEFEGSVKQYLSKGVTESHVKPPNLYPLSIFI